MSTLAPLVSERLAPHRLDDISFGLYKPHYKFDTPEKFKKELERVKDQQKEMIRAGNAASFRTSWTIQGSTKDGEKMQKQYSKLLLRAFKRATR